jgi:hypothetical protein
VAVSEALSLSADIVVQNNEQNSKIGLEVRLAFKLNIKLRIVTEIGKFKNVSLFRQQMAQASSWQI